jgi:hypothetical protein
MGSARKTQRQLNRIPTDCQTVRRLVDFVTDWLLASFRVPQRTNGDSLFRLRNTLSHHSREPGGPLTLWRSSPMDRVFVGSDGPLLEWATCIEE